MVTPLLGYLGPESMLPVASVASVVLGALLLGWRIVRRTTDSAGRWLASFLKRKSGTNHQETPSSLGQEQRA